MRTIALVSITLNAVNPMTEFLSAMPDIHVVNYLDSHILESVREAGITDESMRRMLTMISRAAEDGADGIIITCTMFSKFVEEFNKLFSVPIVAADAAMMDMAGKRGGKTAILCTFAGTKEPSEELYGRCCEKYGNSCEVSTFVLEDAYEAAGRMDMAEHNRIIREAMKKLDADFDNIILAQISMSAAAAGYKGEHAQIFTSPEAAYEALI